MAATKHSQAQSTLKNAMKTVPKPTAESQDYMSRLIRQATEPLKEPVSLTADMGVPEPIPSAPPAEWPSAPPADSPRYQLGRPTSAPKTATVSGMHFDRKQVSRIIFIAAGVDAIAIVIRDRNLKPVSTQVSNQHVITIPASMRAYAAVIVMTVVALIVNEISPTIGVVFAAVMVLMALANTDIFLFLGAIVTPGVPAPAKPGSGAHVPGTITQPGTYLPAGGGGKGFYTGPSGSVIVPVPGYPGQSSIEPLPTYS
jgi:hypothetical protein